MKRIPTSLYKFFSPTKYNREAIEQGYFYFSQPVQLNDPFEFSCQIDISPESTDKFLELQYKFGHITYEDQVRYSVEYRGNKNTKRELNNLMIEFIANHIETAGGVFSASNNPNSPIQWAHYTNNYKGWVLEFEPMNILNELEERHWIEVKYRKHPPKISFSSFDLTSIDGTVSLIETLIETKYEDWGYEKEFRIVKGRKKEAALKQKSPINTQAVKSIIFGWNISEEDKNFVKRATKDWACKYKKAEISRSGYSISLIDAT
ncbi:DUF2971 domain-containing protein [Reinekea blandensis]|uniref:DUF2971 domain-containing protein n=1 Tax=Reinekea blandensis MED297 TaxID=314283 RepID=A4BHA6_9GAMM|nr:DUF2971 domain-containing protein [Reinekea blandensis]EAR08454.1 hypothetical protein MED297_17717 [Reinekea sp. MED297] [Reinekea blandensis MED297]